MAIRPRTLPAAIAPVLIGTAMAYGDGAGHSISALAALAGALLIQIGTNLANDYFDFKKGADTEERVGPVRVTHAGLIRPKAVISAALFIFFLAGLLCLFMIQRGGWPIAAIGVASVLSGFFYTGGPRPLGYLGLGEFFVIIFFGPVAVAGTYYIQSLDVNGVVVLAGIAPGLLSAAILAVNNLRDIDTDQRCGKKTLAVRFGPTFARSEYFFLIMTAALIPVLIYAVDRNHIAILLASSIALLSFPGLYTVFCHSDGPALNQALAYTGKLLLIYSIIFCAGWFI